LAIFLLKLSPSSCNVPYPVGWVGSEATPAQPMRTLVKLRPWKYTLFNIENLVLRARSVLNGFAAKDCELFLSTGAMEYWSVGKSERPNSNLNEFFHYSITPEDFRMKERRQELPLGPAQSPVLWASIFYFEVQR
jgi:hypothetical protein